MSRTSLRSSPPAMPFLTSLLCSILLFSISVIGAVQPAQTPSSTTAKCGKVNIMFTGLPPYHPLVVEQGWDPDMVNRNLKADAQRIIQSGYNLRVAFMGPEQDIAVFRSYMGGMQWDGVGVGYGIRGTQLPALTVRFEEILIEYREQAPMAAQFFNHSPNSTLAAIQRYFPLPAGCPPGKSLGYTEVCDICHTPQVRATNLGQMKLGPVKDADYLSIDPEFDFAAIEA